jgi:thiol:disulfide interchange protein
MFHVMYLVEAGLLATKLSNLLVYFFSTAFPTVMVAMFLAYELLDRRATEGRWMFRVKRFSGRVMFAVVYGLAVVLAIIVTTSLWGETKTAGWVGLLVVSGGLIILVLGSSFMRRLLEDLMNGEW